MDMEDTLVKMPKGQRNSSITLVKGLLQRNPYRRLGANSLRDFKTMVGWFNSDAYGNPYVIIFPAKTK